MKKLAAVAISCLIPFFSFAGSADNGVLDTFQERCAKETDPIKRQNYCHILDQHSQSDANLVDTLQETVVV